MAGPSTTTTSITVTEILAQEIVKLPAPNLKAYLSSIRGDHVENLDEVWLSTKLYFKIRSLVIEITGESKLPLDSNQDPFALRDNITWFIVRVLNGLTPDANINIDVSETRVWVSDLPLYTLNKWTAPQLKALIKPLVNSGLNGSVNLLEVGQTDLPSLVPKLADIIILGGHHTRTACNILGTIVSTPLPSDVAIAISAVPAAALGHSAVLNEPIIESVLESLIQSVIDPIEKPIIESVIHPIVEPIVESAVTNAVLVKTSALVFAVGATIAKSWEILGSFFSAAGVSTVATGPNIIAVIEAAGDPGAGVPGPEFDTSTFFRLVIVNVAIRMARHYYKKYYSTSTSTSTSKEHEPKDVEGE